MLEFCKNKTICQKLLLKAEFARLVRRIASGPGFEPLDSSEKQKTQSIESIKVNLHT